MIYHIQNNNFYLNIYNRVKRKNTNILSNGIPTALIKMLLHNSNILECQDQIESSSLCSILQIL